MTNSKNETIVDRVVLRLKTQPLGDLITEEDLHDIVKDAIPKAFFEKRRVQGRYAGDWIDGDPLIIEVVRELLKDAARKAVEVWLVQNADKMLEYWKQVLDKGLMEYVQSLQSEQANVSIKAVLFPMLNKINEERMRAGMPSLYL